MDLARPLPSQGQALADEGRQRLLEVAGSDALQVEDGDQHLKAVRSPRVSRQDRRRVPNARALGSFAVAHTRLANRDRADAGHDLAFRKMAVAHDALLARLGLEIGMLCEKLSNLRFDGLGQQRTRAAAQDLCEGISKGPWLGELDDVTFQHGVSLLYWRSGGVEHHHDTPPYPVTPSPTSGHSSSENPQSLNCCSSMSCRAILSRPAGRLIMEEPRIRAATADDVSAIMEIVEQASRPYIARMGKPPGPMRDDYAARVLESMVWVLEEGAVIAGIMC